RVYLVTNNPYFGVNSYPGKKVTLKYKNVFDELADRLTVLSRTRSNHPTFQGFKFKVICADAENIAKFNAHYYTAETQDAKLDADSSTEEFILHLSTAGGEGSFLRIPRAIADVQFAVIGDVVFEFILSAPDDQHSKARG